MSGRRCGEGRGGRGRGTPDARFCEPMISARYGAEVLVVCGRVLHQSLSEQEGATTLLIVDRGHEREMMAMDGEGLWRVAAWVARPRTND